MGLARGITEDDAAWLQGAVAVANVPTLVCVLVHLTGDERWLGERYRSARLRGLDDNDSGSLADDVQAEVRSAAAAALREWLAGRTMALPNPTDDQLLRMMSVSLGEAISPDYVPLVRADLGLPPDPRDASATRADAVSAGTAPGMPEGFRALIIGAGISGLCAGIELAKAGIPYDILERRPDVGGVWFENRYPGAACDVPSHLYSFSFAPGDWSRFFADSREIHAYLGRVADDFAVREHVRFGREVVEARFREPTQDWEVIVRTATGESERLHANILISCVGAFNKPRIPDVPGLDTFRGPSMHTARYPDAGIDLHGKHVVLIGNGASAMQVAPAIAEKVASLTIVQRTPQWVAPFPKFGREIPDPLRRLLATVEIYRRWYRVRLEWAFNDKLYDALQIDPDWHGRGRSINVINEAHRRSLKAYATTALGPARHLLPHVLPDYPPFGKRMLLDNGWFRTLRRANVTLVNGAVEQVLPDRVVTTGGIETRADVLIWATGFDVAHFIAPLAIFGKGTHELRVDWRGDDARAYLGLAVPGYPNFFCLYGPNSQFGHGGSLITVLEQQMHYVVSLLRAMFARRVACVDVRREVHDTYNAEVDARANRMVWAFPGVETYYKNSSGRNVVNNPFRIREIRLMTEAADLAEYHCS